MDDFVDFLPQLFALLVVLIAAPMCWYVTVILWRLSRIDPTGVTLRVVAVFSTSIALVVTIFGLVFINNGMDSPVLNPPETMVVTRSTLLVLSLVPTVYFLRWYRRNGGSK